MRWEGEKGLAGNPNIPKQTRSPVAYKNEEAVKRGDCSLS